MIDMVVWVSIKLIVSSNVARGSKNPAIVTKKVTALLANSQTIVIVTAGFGIEDFLENLILICVS